MDFKAILEQLQGFLGQYALEAIGAIIPDRRFLNTIGWITRMVKTLWKKRHRNLSAPVSVFYRQHWFEGAAAAKRGRHVWYQKLLPLSLFSARWLLRWYQYCRAITNFASGVLILIFKFYKSGRFHPGAGHAGTVKEIQIFHGVLQLLDNSLVIIPNGQVTSGTHSELYAEGYRRHDATIGISYDADIDKAKAVIEEVLKGHAQCRAGPGYDIFVKELADSSVNFSVRFMVSNDNFWPSYRHFIEQIKKSSIRMISASFIRRWMHLGQGK